jgi:hypothetical protein
MRLGLRAAKPQSASQRARGQATSMAPASVSTAGSLGQSAPPSQSMAVVGRRGHTASRLR